MYENGIFTPELAIFMLDLPWYDFFLSTCTLAEEKKKKQKEWLGIGYQIGVKSWGLLRGSRYPPTYASAPSPPW